jgi:catechol 2,3-dioxygenase-like lactoylglutathione lyase family enzyme
MTHSTPANPEPANPEPPALAIRTANTILYCRQWQATARFYREVLRLPETHTSDWFIEFELTPTARLSVADERRASIRSAGGAGITITLQVEDIHAAHHRLTGQGAAPGPIQSHAWGAQVFYFHDPEGHRLEVWAPV